MTGKPAFLENFMADAASVMGSLEPGTVGTPHSSAKRLAVVLSPIAWAMQRTCLPLL